MHVPRCSVIIRDTIHDSVGTDAKMKCDNREERLLTRVVQGRIYLKKNSAFIRRRGVVQVQRERELQTGKLLTVSIEEALGQVVASYLTILNPQLKVFKASPTRMNAQPPKKMHLILARPRHHSASRLHVQILSKYENAKSLISR